MTTTDPAIAKLGEESADEIARLASQVAPHRTKGRIGRPSDYTDEIAQLICDKIAAGDSMRAICEEDGLPNRKTVLRWLDERPAFAAKYARAREAQGDVMDEKILSVADACTPETAAADRVKIDAYKWRAAKLAPKRYGDKVALVGGSETDAPIAMTTDRDRAKALAALIAKAKRGE